MRIVRSLLVTGAIVIAIGGCGDVYADPTGETSDVQPTRVDGEKVSDVPRPPCPVTRPRENTSCSSIGETCEYGKSADDECNAVLTCRGAPESGAWEPRTKEACHAKDCPSQADIASIDGTPCTLTDAADAGAIRDGEEAVCNVTDGVCACTTGPDGASAHGRMWVCVRPSSACPAARPLAGASCNGSLVCDYGSCSFKRGLVMECTNGMWLSGGKPCP